MEETPGRDIATPDEVLATFTELLRGDKSAERLKAAEQLAKYHSLFSPKEEDAAPDMSAAAMAVEEAVAEMQGHIICVSDGKNVKVTVSRNADGQFR